MIETLGASGLSIKVGKSAVICIQYLSKDHQKHVRKGLKLPLSVKHLQIKLAESTKDRAKEKNPTKL
jgi:hypothetical protein